MAVITDDELRIKAAELMGVDMAWLLTWDDKTRGLNEEHIPCYHNEMGAAWELAEKANLSIIRVEDEWWAGQFDGSSGDWWFTIGPINDKVAARAITKAFIIAMGENHE